jgi:protein-tyrosine phosphatase
VERTTAVEPELYRVPGTKILLSRIPGKGQEEGLAEEARRENVALIVVLSNDNEARDKGWKSIGELLEALRKHTGAKVAHVEARQGEPLDPEKLLELMPRIREAEQGGRHVLLLCRTGWGRSAATAAAYLVAARGVDPAKAAQTVWKNKLQETPPHHRTLPYKIRKLALNHDRGEEGQTRGNNAA